MKKGPNKETLNNYLSCFTELKQGLDKNPKIKLTVYADKFKIGKQPLTVLKSTGVITKHGNGQKWTGPEPSFQMILNILEIIRNYHKELKKRKMDQGELFQRQPRKRHVKGTQQPTFKNPDYSIYNKEQIEIWRRNYQNQKPDVTNIPIQHFDRSTASEILETDQIKRFKNDPGTKELNRAIIKKFVIIGFNLIKNFFKRGK